MIEWRSWLHLRVNGGHHIYGMAGSTLRLTIPIHGRADLKLGLLRHLMKFAEIEESEL